MRFASLSRYIKFSAVETNINDVTNNQAGVGGIGKTDILLSIRDIFNSDEAAQWLSNIRENITDKDIPFISYVLVKRLLDREGIVLSNIITGTIEKVRDFLIFHPSYPTFSSCLQIVN